jgi:hypothetical protein
MTGPPLAEEDAISRLDTAMAPATLGSMLGNVLRTADLGDELADVLRDDLR